jgi:hypothetical protein
MAQVPLAQPAVVVVRANIVQWHSRLEHLVVATIDPASSRQAIGA